MSMIFKILNPNNIAAVFRAVRKRGLVNTFRYIYHDLLFDLRFGTDTINTVYLDEVDTLGGEESKQHGHESGPVTCYIFDQALANLPIKPEESVFLDVGCGKGRALFLAAQHQFKKVYGIEFACDLVEIAKQNLAAFRRRSKVPSEFEIVCADAATYHIPEDINIFFLNNPFDAVIMEKFLANLLGALRQTPRQAYVVYMHPRTITFKDCPQAEPISIEEDWQIYHILI